MVHAAMAAVQPGEVLVLTHARAAAGGAGRRPARDPGQGAGRRRDPRRRRRCATSRSWPSSGCRSGRAGCACAGAAKDGRRLDRRARRRRRRDDPDRRRARARRRRRRGGRGTSGSTRCSRPRASAPSARCVKREKLQDGALSYDLDGLREKVEAATVTPPRRRPLHDLAHIAHAELLTPFPDESLRFFVELFGMQIEHREGQSVFLRGWGEYQPYGLKLTESELPGLGHTAIRAWSPSALERRVARDRGDRVGGRLERRRPRARPGVRVPRPRRAPVRDLLRAGSLRAARAPAPAAEERAPAPRRPRRRGQADRPRQRARLRCRRQPPVRRRAARATGRTSR